MSDGFLHEGQRAILRPLGSGRLYAVRVEEVREDAVVLSGYLCAGQVAAVAPGTAVEVQYHRRQTVCGFQATVLDCRPGRLPLVTVSRPAEVREVQRREYVRWPVSLPLVVSPVAEGTPVRGRVVDLSGGGLAAEVPGEWEVGLEVRLHFGLGPGRPEARAEARVVRVAGGGTAEQGAAGHGAVRRVRRVPRVAFEFTRIEPAERERIIRYIFDRQREFLRLGTAGRDRGAGV